jgi:hypothetical protein
MALRFYCPSYIMNIVSGQTKGNDVCRICRTELHTAPCLNNLTKDNTIWGTRHRQKDDTEIVAEYRVM